jgi:hypothetical protein
MDSRTTAGALAVLVDPAALTAAKAATYREVPTVGAPFVFRGALASAQARADVPALAAALFFAVSTASSVVVALTS